MSLRTTSSGYTISSKPTISYVKTYYIVSFWIVLATCTYYVVSHVVYYIICHNVRHCIQYHQNLEYCTSRHTMSDVFGLFLPLARTMSYTMSYTTSYVTTYEYHTLYHQNFRYHTSRYTMSYVFGLFLPIVRSM